MDTKVEHWIGYLRNKGFLILLEQKYKLLKLIFLRYCKLHLAEAHRQNFKVTVLFVNQDVTTPKEMYQLTVTFYNC